MCLFFVTQDYRPERALVSAMLCDVMYLRRIWRLEFASPLTCLLCLEVRDDCFLLWLPASDTEGLFHAAAFRLP